MAAQDEELVDLLYAVHRGLAEQMRDILCERRVPFAAMPLLGHLHRAPGLTVSELARRTGIAKSHISTTVEAAVRRGWVEKRPDPADQRRQRLYLTPQARAEWQEVRAALRERLSGLVAGIPPETTAALMAGLRALQAELGKARKGEQSP